MKLFFRITLKIFLILTILVGCAISESDEQLNQSAAFYNKRGFAYLKKGQYDKAISDYTRAIEINPKDARAYRGRGVAYIGKGQHDKAISDFNRAKELNPNYDMGALVKKNEDVLSVIAKSVDFSQLEVSKEIYTDNATLKHEDSQTGRMHKFKGFNEIENWRKERGKTWHRTELFLISIEREADKAHVKCGVIVTDVENSAEWIKLSCSTKMLKIGSTWKIKEQIIKNKNK